MNFTHYHVQVWHLKKDTVSKYRIPANDCYPRGGGQRPVRTIAGIRARELCAHELNEEYSPNVHKVLSITEGT
jgi:hypothetical protein